ncbi:MAG: MarR family transcriptional regulator [Dehalococcoidia bacterium]|nr:MAG: MarR family transcriptional regulator [Dehalococcoidia bacterium]
MGETGTRGDLIAGISSRMREMMEARSRVRRQEHAPEPWLELDLTMKQLKVLFVLDGSGSLRPSEIAASVGMSAASATGILDRLVDQGFVERRADAADRRALLVQLTESGARVVSDFYMSGQYRLTELLTLMSDADLKALDRGFSALVAAARSQLAQHPNEGVVARSQG